MAGMMAMSGVGGRHKRQAKDDRSRDDEQWSPVVIHGWLLWVNISMLIR
jgi:hypothetical protein